MTLADDRPIDDAELSRQFSDLPPAPLLLAVSGGLDSMVMLHLFARWLRLPAGIQWLSAAESLHRKATDDPRALLPRPAVGLPARPPRLSAQARWLPRPLTKNRLIEFLRTTPVVVATVDHGLRAESAAEAAYVANTAATLGFPHQTLAWTSDERSSHTSSTESGPGSSGPERGLQARAREARYRLLADAIEDELWLYRTTASLALPRRVIVTAHNQGDMIETFLMNLKRGSGLDGLAAIRMRTTHRRPPIPDRPYPAPMQVYRPLLDFPRSRLAATARLMGIDWCEDPSNTDPRFERVRTRHALPELEALGFARPHLALSIHRLQRARELLEGDLQARASAPSEALPRLETNGGLFATIRLTNAAAMPSQLPSSTRLDEAILRLLQRAIALFGGGSQAPALSQVEELMRKLQGQLASPEHTPNPRSASHRGWTLGGCRVDIAALPSPDQALVRIWREAGRRSLPELHLTPGDGAWWDDRFAVSVSRKTPSPIVVRALGATNWSRLKRTVPAFAGWRGPPPGAVAALPAIWRDGDLVAVPFLETLECELPPQLQVTIRAACLQQFGNEARLYRTAFHPPPPL